MATYSYATPQDPDWWAEARQTMRDAMKSPAVLVTVIICLTLLGLALVAVLGWLAWAQRDATTILTMVNMFISVFLLKKMADVNGRVGSIEKQTNGHTTRLMDAALKDKES